MKSSDDQDTLLDNLDDDWVFTSRTSPLPPAGEDSSGSIDLDYSSDKEETDSVKSFGDKGEKDSIGDNSSCKEQGDTIMVSQEIMITTKKPVLTQQGIMDLIENQASSKRTVSAAGWERRKEKYGQMLDGYESPTSRTVQVDVGLATLMIISAVAENTNRINLAAQHEQREMMMRQAELHRETLERESSQVVWKGSKQSMKER